MSETPEHRREFAPLYEWRRSPLESPLLEVEFDGLLIKLAPERSDEERLWLRLQGDQGAAEHFMRPALLRVFLYGQRFLLLGSLEQARPGACRVRCEFPRGPQPEIVGHSNWWACSLPLDAAAGGAWLVWEDAGGRELAAIALDDLIEQSDSGPTFHGPPIQRGGD
jgi:hypothetical protein